MLMTLRVSPHLADTTACAPHAAWRQGRVVAASLMLLMMLLGATGTASAQTITSIDSSDPNVIFYEPELSDHIGTDRLELRGEECQRSASLVIKLEITGATSSNYPLEVWASQSGDCTELDSRKNDALQAPAECWLLHKGSNNAEKLTLRIPVREMLARTPGGVLNDIELSSDVCSAYSDAPLILTIMHVDHSGLAVGAKTLTISVNTLGPAAPDSVTVSAADRSLFLDWAADTTELTTSYRVYCLPADQQENELSAASFRFLGSPIEAGDGGLLRDAATETASGDSSSPVTPDDSAPAASEDTELSDDSDGSADGDVVNTEADATGSSDAAEDEVSGTSECSANAYFNGTTLDLAAANEHLCSTATARGGELKTDTSLDNGTRYAVVMVALDDAENAGNPKLAGCATPKYYADFFETYRASGGQGGGGFCECSMPARGPLRNGVAWSSLLLSCCLIFARRVTSRACSKKDQNL